MRVEKRPLKVLKALADYHDITPGDLLEGIVLHAFDGRCPFGKPPLEVIARLKKIYGLELDASARAGLRPRCGRPSPGSPR